jgi:hypothetical protein
LQFWNILLYCSGSDLKEIVFVFRGLGAVGVTTISAYCTEISNHKKVWMATNYHETGSTGVLKIPKRFLRITQQSIFLQSNIAIVSDGKRSFDFLHKWQWMLFESRSTKPISDILMIL